MKLTGGDIVVRALVDERASRRLACVNLVPGAGLTHAFSGIAEAGRPLLVDVVIDYSEKTFFTAGVVKTNLLRFSWPDRLRFIGRALKRNLFQ